jgi:hypothetical protein
MSLKIAIAVSLALAAFAGSACAHDGGRVGRHRADASVSSRLPAQVLWAVPSGQSHAPRELAARSALPACGFAAIESWGANGFQFCDPRNVHTDAF